MATRSCVAYKTKYGWKGVYSHWDGYPRGVGKVVYDIIMQRFLLNKGRFGVSNNASVEKKLQAFIDIYIKGHPGGWSIFGEECYCHSPEFVMRDGFVSGEITNETVDALSIEWVYIIDSKRGKLIILTNARDKGFVFENGFKISKYKHYKVCELELNPDLPEPDWKLIEMKGEEISEKYYKKYEKEV